MDTTSSQTSPIATTGLVIAFVFSLLHSLNTIDRVPILPYMPAATLGTLFITAITCALIQKNILLYIRKVVRERLFAGLNIFGLIILFSTLYSKFPFPTFSRALQFIIVTNCMYYLLTQTENLSTLFERIAKLTIYFMLSACIYGLVLFFFGTETISNDIEINQLQLFGLEIKQRLYGQRISSFLANPNPFGFRLMIAILFCLYFIRVYKSRWYAFLFFILIYTLLLTQSRASALGLAIAFCFFFYCTYISNHRYKSLIIIVFSSSLAALILYVSFDTIAFEKLYSIMGDRSSALTRREVAWKALLAQIRETPWLGIGYQASAEYVLKANSIEISNSHNLYLAIFSEVGIVGLMAFVWVYFSPFIYYIIRKGSSFTANNLQIIALTCLLAFLVNQGFEEMFASHEFPFMITVLFLYIAQQTLPPKIKQ